jgi:hypothetical protein
MQVFKSFLGDRHRNNLASNIWGGGANATIGIRNFKKSSYKEGEDWFEPVLNICTPLTPILTQICLFAPFKSAVKTLFMHEKNIGEHLAPFPPQQVMPMTTAISIDKISFVSSDGRTFFLLFVTNVNRFMNDNKVVCVFFRLCVLTTLVLAPIEPQHVGAN